MDLITLHTNAEGADELRAVLDEFPSVSAHVAEIHRQEGGGESLWSIGLKIVAPIPTKLWEVFVRLANSNKIGSLKITSGNEVYEFKHITVAELESVQPILMKLVPPKNG